MVLDEILTYRVFKTDVIVPHYVRALKPDPDKDIVTLLTCTPYGINSHRLLVFGERIPTETAEVAPPAPVPFPRQLACVIVASLLALILVLLVARMLSKRMESHNRKR